MFVSSLTKGNNNNNRDQQGSPRQTRRPQRNEQTPGTNSREPIKFEGEFDFESANAKFEEIEKEFTEKLKISGGGSSGKHQNNDTSLSTSQSLPSHQDMQDQHMLMKQKSLSTGVDSNEQTGGKDSHHRDGEDKAHYYDKNNSFFDRISCEANEKMKAGQKNWKEEKKINYETFGIAPRMDKMNYNRSYNNGGYNRYNNQSNGRNYPRNGGNGQSRPGNNTNTRYNSSNNNNNSSNQQQRSGVAVGGNGRDNQSRGYNNNRRNDMDSSSYGQSRSSNGGQSRRFGSR